MDFDDTYSPTMSWTSYLVNEAIAVNTKGVVTEAWDISGAYYHCTPLHKQFAEQPAGHERAIGNGDPGAFIVELLCAMPDARDSGLHLHRRLQDVLANKVGMRRNSADHSCYRMTLGNDYITLCFYVDDIAAFSTSQSLMDRVYAAVSKHFAVKRAAPLTLLLGVHVKRDTLGTHMHQQPLIEKIAETAGITIAGTKAKKLELAEVNHPRDEPTDCAAGRFSFTSLFFLNLGLFFSITALY